MKEFSKPKLFLESISATDSLYVIRNQNNMFWKTSTFFPRLMQFVQNIW